MNCYCVVLWKKGLIFCAASHSGTAPLECSDSPIISRVAKKLRCRKEHLSSW